MKRFMIDQGSRAEIMYPDLYKGLGLKDEDLTKYDTPLVGFNRKIRMLTREIKLPVVTEGKGGDGEFHSGSCFHTIYSNLGTIVDSCHRGRAIHAALEVEVPY